MALWLPTNLTLFEALLLLPNRLLISSNTHTNTFYMTADHRKIHNWKQTNTYDVRIRREIQFIMKNFMLAELDIFQQKR